MNWSEMLSIVSSISYKPGWTLKLERPMFDRPYVQIVVDESCEAALSPFDGSRTGWSSGKRYLSYHMCRQEVVGACFGLIQDAEMHEMREWFKYKGRSIFNPHIDPDALADLVRFKNNLNMRENAMTMEESDDPEGTR